MNSYPRGSVIMQFVFKLFSITALLLLL